MSSYRKKFMVGAGLGIAFGTLCGGLAMGHHSGTLFDSTKFFAIRGTVTKWEWANPHSWLYVTVPKADGSTEVWGFEAGGPNMLMRKGWHADDIEVGDKVTVDSHIARNGDHLGMLQAIYFEDGRVLSEGVEGGPGPKPSKTPQGQEYK